MEYTVYSNATGEILRVVGKPDGDGNPTLEAGESFLEGKFKPSKYKVADGVPLPKTENPAAINKTQITAGGEYAMVSNLSNPSRVLITGNDESFCFTVTDGELEFSLDTKGNYIVKCMSAIDLDATFGLGVI